MSNKLQFFSSARKRMEYARGDQSNSSEKKKKKQIKHGIATLFSFLILFVFIITAVFGPYIAPNDPYADHLDRQLEKPSAEFPFGTDHLGRCIMSRIIYGSAISLSSSFVVVFVSLVFGMSVGLISGYYGGIIDNILMRVTDAFLAFPGLLLALGISGIFGAGYWNMVLALVVVEWSGYARLTRGTVLDIKQRNFIKAVVSMGAGDAHIILRHILPNIMSPLIVMATVGMGYVILSAAGLSFLGFGVQPPTPEWGYMLTDGRAYIRSAPYVMIFPGLAIMLTVLAFSYIGDHIRDRLDPRDDHMKQI